MAFSSLEELYIHELKDLYSSEQQVAKVLPIMIEAASTDDLQAVLVSHLDQTKVHINSLKSILDTFEISDLSHVCHGMKGIIAEFREVLRHGATPDVMNAALVAGAVRVENYEIAGYRVASHFAQTLGRTVDVLQLTGILNEEVNTETLLLQIAESHVADEAR